MRTLFGLWVICYSSLLFANAQPNDEKLINALIEQGIICEGLSYEQQQKHYPSTYSKGLIIRITISKLIANPLLQVKTLN